MWKYLTSPWGGHLGKYVVESWLFWFVSPVFFLMLKKINTQLSIFCGRKGNRVRTWCVVGDGESWVLLEPLSATWAGAVKMNDTPVLPHPCVWPVSKNEHFSQSKNTVIWKELLILLAHELEKIGTLVLQVGQQFLDCLRFSPQALRH